MAILSNFHIRVFKNRIAQSKMLVGVRVNLPLCDAIGNIYTVLVRFAAFIGPLINALRKREGACCR